MSNVVTSGDFTITAVDDGEGHLPPPFFPGADFTAHPGQLHEDGTYHNRIGAYLVQGRGQTVLVDAGMGQDNVPFPAALAAGLPNPPEFLATAGRLPDSLAAAGVKPEDVTAIVLTHLHRDHIGWVVQDGRLFFPHAEVYYGAADWDALIAPAEPDDPARLIMEFARNAGVLRPLTTPSAQIAPGITALHAPGHTPGSYIVKVSSASEAVHLVGDVIEHPLQLTENDISFILDLDKDLAATTREELFGTILNERSTLAAAHMADPVFRHITTDREWAPA
jgi:glyoxylase-like metal-dependent hydrolase (beta-lactamase superfamily II)